MRNKTTAAIVLIALAGAITFSVTGQEEPLPVITPKEIPLAAPTIALAVEPLAEFRQPTILEAARNNDYISFRSLYDAAVERGENVAQFATLHELWTYAINDPIGAFYGTETYEKLSRAYPGYAAYIEQYRIIDSRGNVFYPTSETRAFLLDRAVEARPAPRVQVAETASSRAKSRDPLPKRETPASAPTRTPAPAPAVHEPVVVTSEAAVPAAPPVATPAPAVATPAPAAVTAPAPVVAAPLATDTAIIATRDNPTGRGILLVIVGLIGIGLLALILQTPREQPPVSIIQTQPPNNVEPLRKTDAPAPPPAAGTKAS